MAQIQAIKGFADHFEKAGRILKMIGKALDSLNLCHD